MELYDILIPMVVLLVPSFLLYEISGNKSGLIGGAVLGTIIIYSAGLFGAWILIVGIMGTASLFFGDRLMSNGGGKE